MKNALPYQITRIRLINFHNFVDETIELAHGGHLFLLGDNGCGKTTVLDAIHYVLTAGQSLEWNAAARVAGSKREGRRVQGIVMRYNLDTGAMNSQGGVTYALLEIKGRHGLPLTIGVGLSTSAMDERVRQWGIIRECPLVDLPVLLTDLHGRRPADRLELKEALGQRGGFHNDIKSYQHELARRLFGDEETYGEICRFLAMGKAYREIASQAADYHELFKGLLPEPKSEIFERIIEALRTLEQAKSLLDDLEGKLGYLRDLQAMTQTIAAEGEAALRYQWLAWRMREELATQAIADLRRQWEERQGQVAALTVARIRAEEDESALRRQLDDLKLKDAGGLVRQEKEGREELNRKETALAGAKRQGQERGKARQAATRRRHDQDQAVIQRIGALHGHLAQEASRLPFSISGLLSQLDAMARASEPLPQALTFQAPEASREADAARDQELRQQALLEQQATELACEARRLEDDCQRLSAMGEAQPGLPGWTDCLAALRATLLSPRPLYAGLEWRPGLGRAEQEAIEEAIGQEVSAILILPKGEFEAGRDIASQWPGVRLATPNRGLDALPEWLRGAFDLSRSDPDSLRLLAAEMVSDFGPLVSTTVQRRRVLSFRGHDRGLLGNPPRLIGEASRREAIALELKQRQEARQQAKRQQEAVARQLKASRQRGERLDSFRTALAEGGQAIREAARLAEAASAELHRQEELFRLHSAQQEALSRETTQLAERLRGLTRLIQQEGLAGLETRIRQLTAKLHGTREEMRRLDTALGEAKAGQEANQEASRRQEEIRQEAADQRARCAERLTALVPGLADIDHYVLRTRKGAQFKTLEAVHKEREACERTILETRVRLRERLNDPQFGAAFRFQYEEGDNAVLDYRGRRLAEISSQLDTEIGEQHEIINERTRELFKKIIMTDLVNYLRSHVSHLEEMVRTIRQLLGKRRFGNQGYRFRIKPQDKYSRLVTVINKFSPFDPGAEEELRHFFEDHRQEIINTEVGSIPEELDYRNWYRYEMEVTAGSEQGVVMDRRSKGLGSGGEQAVPNYLLVLTIAHFLYRGKQVRLHALLFDEAFYGIDAGRRDQLLGFATDLGLQLFVASPDQDGVRREISYSTTILVKKDRHFDVHLYPYHWQNPDNERQIDLFAAPREPEPVAFGQELP